MNAEQREKWLLKGEVPTRAVTEASTTSKEAPAGAPEGATGTPAPGSEPGKPGEQKKGGDANARIRELAAENKRLKDQLATQQQPPQRTDVPPAPSPGQQQQRPQQQQQQPAPPKEPVPPDALNFKGTHAEYEAAMRKYQADLVNFLVEKRLADDRAKVERDTQQRRIEQFNNEIKASWADQTTKAKAKYSDFQQVAIDQKIPINEVMDRLILQSKHGAELLYKLGSNLAEAERISKLDPLSCFKAMVLLEHGIEGAGAAAPAGGTAPASPAPKPQGSNAPPPVADLGARNGKPADEMEKALKDGDFATYKRLADARDLRK